MSALDLSRFLLDVAGVPAPPRLPALLELLAEDGLLRVDPQETAGLHPLLVPIGRDREGLPVGFLRWPTPGANAQMPVVVQDSHGLRMLAPSTHALLEGRVPGRSLAERMKIGVAPSFFEDLIDSWRARGDLMAALVTADRATQAFEGWARPLAVRARLLAELGREEEARDGARWSLLQPVWTLGEPFAPIARLAGWVGPIGGAPYRRLAEAPDKPILDRAAHLMDAACADGEAWDGLRAPLAALYAEAGLHAVARLVGRSAGSLLWA